MKLGSIKLKDLSIPEKYDCDEYRSLACDILRRFDSFCAKDENDLKYEIEETYFMDSTLCPLPQDQDCSCLKKLVLDDPFYVDFQDAAEQEIEGRELTGKEADHVYEMSGLSLMMVELFEHNEDQLCFNHAAHCINKFLNSDNPKLETLFILASTGRSPDKVCEDLASDGWAWPTDEQYDQFLTDLATEEVDRFGFDQALGAGLEATELYFNKDDYDLDMFNQTRMDYKDCKLNSFKESILKLETAKKIKPISFGKITSDPTGRFSAIYTNAVLFCTGMMDQENFVDLLKNLDQSLKFGFNSSKNSNLAELIYNSYSEDLDNLTEINSKEIIKQSFLYSLKKQGIKADDQKVEQFLNEQSRSSGILSLGGVKLELKPESKDTFSIKEHEYELVDDDFMKAYKESLKSEKNTQNKGIKL